METGICVIILFIVVRLVKIVKKKEQKKTRLDVNMRYKRRKELILSWFALKETVISLREVRTHRHMHTRTNRERERKKERESVCVNDWQRERERETQSKKKNREKIQTRERKRIKSSHKWFDYVSNVKNRIISHIRTTYNKMFIKMFTVLCFISVNS